MKQFEATYRDGFDFYERVFDTDLGRSIKRQVTQKYEWYEPSSRGIYSYILDDSIKLDKKQGNSAKAGREHYGFQSPDYRNIRDNYWNKEGGYNTDPRIWYLDIETRVGTCSTGFPVPEKAMEPITSFQVYDNYTETMILLGTRAWTNQQHYLYKIKDELDLDVRYIQCDDEIHMIETFLHIYERMDPLIVYAWNGLGFDFPYIYNRLKNLGMETGKLSNYGKVSYSEGEFQGKVDFKFSADGHFWIDLMDVYKKFTFHPMPSYSLDTVAEHELGEKKVNHDHYGSFDNFYTANDGEFEYYGVKDAYLIKRIDEAQNFTVLMTMIAEKMGVQLSDSLGTVKPWSTYIQNKSLLNNQVMPMRQEFPDPHVVGGYVRDPNKGKHKWVVSADVNSMYPLLGMVGFNMSPETFVPKYKLPENLRDIVLQYFNDQEESKRFDLSDDVWAATTKALQDNNMALGVNGAVFKKDKLGMIPEMVQEIYDGRKQAKKTMFDYTKRSILIKEILKERA